MDKKEIDKMISLREKGLSSADVAEKMFVSEGTISKYTKAVCTNVKKNSNYISKYQKDKIEKEKNELRRKERKRVSNEIKMKNIRVEEEKEEHFKDALGLEKQYYKERYAHIFKY